MSGPSSGARECPGMGLGSFGIPGVRSWMEAGVGAAVDGTGDKQHRSRGAKTAPWDGVVCPLGWTCSGRPETG
jgi:hypothetical protein